MERRPENDGFAPPPVRQPVRGPEFALLIAAAAAAVLAAALPGRETDPVPLSEAALLFDLNSASALELSLLPGIGPSHARKIVLFREAGGVFRTPSDLRLVPGLPKSAAAAASRHASVRDSRRGGP